MYSYVDGWMVGWMIEWMVGWMDGWMVGWMDDIRVFIGNGNRMDWDDGYGEAVGGKVSCRSSERAID